MRNGCSPIKTALFAAFRIDTPILLVAIQIARLLYAFSTRATSKFTGCQWKNDRKRFPFGQVLTVKDTFRYPSKEPVSINLWGFFLCCQILKLSVLQGLTEKYTLSPPKQSNYISRAFFGPKVKLIADGIKPWIDLHLRQLSSLVKHFGGLCLLCKPTCIVSP